MGAKHRALAVAGLLFGLLAAGCLEGGAPPAGQAREFLAAGTFTEEATQEEMAEAGEEARLRGGHLVVLESFPAQYHARFASASACESFHEWMRERAYVQQARPCVELEPHPAPETPDASEAAYDWKNDSGGTSTRSAETSSA